MNKGLWIGLGLDFVGAIVLTVGIFAMFESSTLGYTLIGIGTLLMLVGVFVSVAGGFSSSFKVMDSIGSGFQWVPGPPLVPGGAPPAVGAPFDPNAQTAAAGAMADHLAGGVGGAQGETRLRLQQHGVLTDAVVVQARNTGQTAGTRSALVDIDLEISPKDRAAYTFSAREAVHPTAIGRLVPSTALKVRVDPDNTLDVIVDWTASGLAAPV